MPAELVTGDRSNIEALLTKDFQNAASGAMAAKGAFRVVLAGGSIARLFFPALARLPLDWSRVYFFWADERAVPPDHPESNFAEAERLWLTPAGVPSQHVHRMRGEDPDVRRAAQAYAAELTQTAGTPPSLDFALLGVGPDGHVASLFPDHPALREEHELVVPILDAPKPPPRRITLTLPVLAAAARVVVAAEGQGKAAVIGKSMETGSSLPLGMLISRAQNVRVLLVK